MYYSTYSQCWKYEAKQRRKKNSNFSVIKKYLYISFLIFSANISILKHSLWASLILISSIWLYNFYEKIKKRVHHPCCDWFFQNLLESIKDQLWKNPSGVGCMVFNKKQYWNIQNKPVWAIWKVGCLSASYSGYTTNPNPSLILFFRVLYIYIFFISSSIILSLPFIIFLISMESWFHICE